MYSSLIEAYVKQIYNLKREKMVTLTLTLVSLFIQTPANNKQQICKLSTLCCGSR